VSSQMEEVGIVIKADGTVELANGMKLSGQQIENVSKHLDTLSGKLQKVDGDQKKVSTGAKQVAQDMGSAAEKVAQAGQQLARGDWQGVARDMAQTAVESRVLTGTMLAAGLAVGVVAAGLGGIAYAALLGAKAERELNDQLTLTGNFAGMVTGQVDAMARSLAGNVKGSVGGAREVLGQLVATGRFTTDSLEQAGAAALLLQRYTGQTSQQVVQHFAGMADGVAKWAARANESYHFLSIEQFLHIQRLEEQGRKQEAMRVTADALAKSLGGDLTKNLGTLEQLWKGVADWASKAWQNMLNVGKENSVEDKIANLQARIDTITNSRKGRYTQEQKDSLVAGLRTEMVALQIDGGMASQAAAGKSIQAQWDEAAIKKASEKKKNGPKDTSASENYLASLDKQLRSLSGQTSTYTDVLDHLKANVNQFTLEEGYAALAIAENIDALRNKKTANEAELKYLQETSVAREKSNATWLDQQNLMREELRDREFEISLIGKTAQEVARLTAARQIEKAASGRRGQVMGDYDAGAIDGPTMNKRLDEIDAAAARAMVQRNTQLAQDFKPGWEKLLDGWKNTTQLMRDAHDNAMTGILRSGEDMWVELATTGKVNARSMVNAVLGEYARLQFRQFAAGPMAAGGNSLLSMLGFAGGGNVASVGSSGWGMDIGFGHSGMVVGGAPTFSRNVDMGVFRNAPRFHTGGLASDEVPIIAKKREGIFTEEQMAALAPVGSGNSVTYAPTINIDARTDRAEVQMLVERGVRAGQADLLEKMDRRQI
jgi:phage-related minor tail protein